MCPAQVRGEERVKRSRGCDKMKDDAGDDCEKHLGFCCEMGSHCKVLGGAVPRFSLYN